MNSRTPGLVDHDPRNARLLEFPRRFLFARLRGRRAWQGSRTRGRRLTRPYRLTSASDLTRNSLSRSLARFSCISISEFSPRAPRDTSARWGGGGEEAEGAEGAEACVRAAARRLGNPGIKCLPVDRSEISVSSSRLGFPDGTEYSVFRSLAGSELSVGRLKRPRLASGRVMGQHGVVRGICD